MAWVPFHPPPGPRGGGTPGAGGGGHHLGHGALVAHHDEQVLGPGDRGVEDPTGHQHRGALQGGQDHRPIFAALGFVYSDGEGGLQFPQHVRGVLHDLAVEVHHHALLVHRTDNADVPIEHPHAGGGAVLLPPEDVIVVLHLHHPVPRTEDPVSEAALPLALRRRIESGLEGLVEDCGAGAPAAGGGEDLNLVRGDPHPLGQPAAAQVYDGLHGQLGVPAAEEKEVAVVFSQVGEFPGVYHVGIADDGALGGLAEDLRQTDHGHRPAADQVGEQIARPHRGQLVRVPHQHQAAVPTQGGEKGGHQGHVHHGHLVHDDRVCL